MMSGATIQARPVAYMTAEGAMSANFMSFPHGPIFGPPQYFSGGRGGRGDLSSFQFVNPNHTYTATPLDFPGYSPGYGNVPFSDSK